MSSSQIQSEGPWQQECDKTLGVNMGKSFAPVWLQNLQKPQDENPEPKEYQLPFDCFPEHSLSGNVEARKGVARLPPDL